MKIPGTNSHFISISAFIQLKYITKQSTMGPYINIYYTSNSIFKKTRQRFLFNIFLNGQQNNLQEPHLITSKKRPQYYYTISIKN